MPPCTTHRRRPGAAAPALSSSTPCAAPVRCPISGQLASLPKEKARTLEQVRSEAPPKHWASAEMPVVYDLARRALVYFEKTPLWGGAYYAGFRKEIQALLGSGAPRQLP